MVTKVQKWGNSLAVRLPKATIQSLKLREGVKVTIRSSSRGVWVEPVVRRETLNDLLKKMTPQNTHLLVDWGSDVGKEIVE